MRILRTMQIAKRIGESTNQFVTAFSKLKFCEMPQSHLRPLGSSMQHPRGLEHAQHAQVAVHLLLARADRHEQPASEPVEEHQLINYVSSSRVCSASRKKRTWPVILTSGNKKY